MLIQILISVLAAVAILGVTRNFKKGALSKGGLVLWILVWGAAVVLVWNPAVTNRVAGILGVGRGADAVFYLSIVVLFYMIFRLYGKLENLEHQLSELVKKIALKDLSDRR